MNRRRGHWVLAGRVLEVLSTGEELKVEVIRDRISTATFWCPKREAQIPLVPIRWVYTTLKAQEARGAVRAVNSSKWRTCLLPSGDGDVPRGAWRPDCSQPLGSVRNPLPLEVAPTREGCVVAPPAPKKKRSRSKPGGVAAKTKAAKTKAAKTKAVPTMAERTTDAPSPYRDGRFGPGVQKAS